MRRNATSFLVPLICALLFTGSSFAQQKTQTPNSISELAVVNGRLVEKRAYWTTPTEVASPKASKSSTITPNFFLATAPAGLPRSGVAGFVLEYSVPAVSTAGTENIDYFAFTAPSGWTITAISTAPPQTACASNPHTSVIQGFSASSAYWGGDYGGGVVTPGTPGTYPAVGARSFDGGGCGAWSTTTSAATADTLVFQVTMTPSASGQCPGTTTNALPLCCSGAEIGTPGSAPPAGSEPYFNELTAASDGNGDPFGDAWFYVSLECPNPFLVLEKFPLFAPVVQQDCIDELVAASPFLPPDTLVIPDPPANPAQFCYAASNISDLIQDPWWATQCDSVQIDDDSLGEVLSLAGLTLLPGGTLVTEDDSVVAAPPVDTCWPNLGVATCTTPAGSDYVQNVGVQTGQRNTSDPQSVFAPLDSLGFDRAAICTETFLPVELASITGRYAEDRIILEWVTATETNNSGFAVEHRMAGDAGFRQVGFVEGGGTKRSESQYSFALENPEPGTHVFRLRQIDFDGSVEIHGEIEVAVGVPGTHFLTESYPNPFVSTANMALSVGAEQNVSIGLYDAAGRLVTSIYDGVVPAERRVTFTVDGSGLSNGMYFVRVTGEAFSDTRSLTLTR
jgi:hypothetical protein